MNNNKCIYIKNKYKIFVFELKENKGINKNNKNIINILTIPCISVFKFPSKPVPIV